MIKVENKVDLYEVNGTEVNVVPAPTVSICSHCINNKMIVIDMGNEKLTVKAADMLAAIANATNTSRF
jgi:hypothetical protein